MDCIVHGIAKSGTRLSDFHFHLFFTPKVEDERQETRQPCLSGVGSPLRTSVLVTLGRDDFVSRTCPVYCRIFSNIPGFFPVPRCCSGKESTCQ